MQSAVLSMKMRLEKVHSINSAKRQGLQISGPTSCMSSKFCDVNQRLKENTFRNANNVLKSLFKYLTQNAKQH